MYYTNEDINYDKIEKTVHFWVVCELSLFFSCMCSRTEVSVSLVILLREVLFVFCEQRLIISLPDLLTGLPSFDHAFLGFLASYQYQEVLVHDKCTSFNWFVKLSS